MRISFGHLYLKLYKFYKKKNNAEIGHSDLLSVYKSNFVQMPISRENMKLFWFALIKMVPELNCF